MATVRLITTGRSPGSGILEETASPSELEALASTLEFEENGLEIKENVEMHEISSKVLEIEKEILENLGALIVDGSVKTLLEVDQNTLRKTNFSGNINVKTDPVGESFYEIVAGKTVRSVESVEKKFVREITEINRKLSETGVYYRRLKEGNNESVLSLCFSNFDGEFRRNMSKFIGEIVRHYQGFGLLIRKLFNQRDTIFCGDVFRVDRIGRFMLSELMAKALEEFLYKVGKNPFEEVLLIRSEVINLYVNMDVSLDEENLYLQLIQVIKDEKTVDYIDGFACRILIMNRELNELMGKIVKNGMEGQEMLYAKILLKMMRISQAVTTYLDLITKLDAFRANTKTGGGLELCEIDGVVVALNTILAQMKTVSLIKR